MQPTPPNLEAVSPTAQPVILEFSGQLRVQADAEPQLTALIAQHPALGLLLRKRFGRFTIAPQWLALAPTEWHSLHHALLQCAALAWDGVLHVSCDAWDSAIHASAPRHFPRRQPKFAARQQLSAAI